LWFKITAPTVATDSGKGTQNAERVPSTSNHTRKISLIHQLAKKTSQKTLQISASGKECSAVCVLHRTPNYAAEDQMTLNWKIRT
jgi:hypothetical protein